MFCHYVWLMTLQKPTCY